MALNLTDRQVKAATTTAGKRRIEIADAGQPGLLLRVESGGAKSFVWRVMINSKRRAMTIGDYPSLGLADARAKVAALKVRLANGDDPFEQRAIAKAAGSVNDLVTHYIETVAPTRITRRGTTKSTAVIAHERSMLNAHVVPLLGDKRVVDVTQRDIRRFITDVSAGKTAVDEKTEKKRGRRIVRGGPGIATRVTALLGLLFSVAIDEGWRSDNPVSRVKTPQGSPKGRPVDPDEYRLLGAALSAEAARKTNSGALRAIRLYALTGMRKKEALNLRWADVDTTLGMLRLTETKTGARKLVIGPTLAKWLHDQRGDAPAKGWVCPRPNGKGPVTDLQKRWEAITERQGLDAWWQSRGLDRLGFHGLRHGFGSHGAQLGYSDALLANLLGHAARGVTGRYTTHIGDSAVRDAVERIATTLAGWLDEGAKGKLTGADIISLNERREAPGPQSAS